jgi:hypothetical protein
MKNLEDILPDTHSVTLMFQCFTVLSALDETCEVGVLYDFPKPKTTHNTALNNPSFRH